MSGQLFADLCDQLLLTEAENRGYSFKCPSDRAGDFKGLDAYSEDGKGGNFEGVIGKVGFQYKFFPSESAPLQKNHKDEIEKSLKFANEYNNDLKAWILVTPEDFNKYQEEWFSELHVKHSIKFSVRHWGQKQLARLISKSPETAIHIYPDLISGIRPPTFQEMCVSLIKQLTPAPHHSAYHINIRITGDNSADGELLSFVSDDLLTLFCLLGSYGTGKTTALEHLSISLARKFLKDPSSRIPLLIRMRHVRGAGTLRDNLMRYFETEYGLKLDIATLQNLNASGRLVLLFDGLDESDGASQKKLGKGILSEIYQFLSPSGKLVISSRTEFFNSAVEERTGLFGLQRPHILAMKGRAVHSLDRRGKITYVDLLLLEQVKKYLNQRLGKQAAFILPRLNSIYDLKDIVRRPVLLDMVCKTLPHFEKESGEILAADLYYRYVVAHLNQDIESGRIEGPVDKRMSEVAQVAEYMLVHDKFRLPHNIITTDILHADNDSAQGFLTSAFLLRDPNGIYEFSHRSFMEYFGALCMFTDIQNLNLASPMWKALSKYTREQLAFFNQIVESNWQELTFDFANRTEAEPLSNGVISHKEPVTLQQFRSFLELTGYKALSPIEGILGYAGVCWYDAIAYALWAGARIQTAEELTSLFHSEFPHGHLLSGEIPMGSVFSVTGSGWERVILSSGSITFLRGKREWAWPATQVGEGWVWKGERRIISTFRLSRGDLAVGVFRCVYGPPHFNQDPP